VCCASFSLDDSRIVAAFDNPTFGIWDAYTGASIANRSGHRDYINAIRYSPDGKRILTASVDKTARIWDANLTTQLALLQHVEYLNSARYSHDGKRIVTGTNDTAVRIWDADSATQIVAMLGHERNILDAAFSPDGSRVVSASLDRTIRIWNARTGTQLAVLPGHTDRVDAVVYSPDGTHIASASRDKTARIWDAEVPADLPGQILWAQAAESDPLTELQTRQLGLPPATHATMLLERASACDLEAGAFYDPERRAPGVEQARINAETAKSACLVPANGEFSARRDYQAGRALLANDNIREATSSFELAVTKGYAAALVDLADLLADPSAKSLDPARAVALYQQAWNKGVSIAGFKLGQLYEGGISEPDARTRQVFQPEPRSAWLWYEKAAAVGQCDALARFAERAESNAMSAESASVRNARLLEAFQFYARAADLARTQEWPDDAWRAWRYHRATLARVLAREGMMQQVADTYRTVLDESVRGAPTFLETLRGLLH
jgi:TPR repeat protein